MRGVGVTADTGFLIGLERNKDRALGVLARLGKQRVSVPVAIVAEWWRGSARQVHVLRLLDKPEPMTEAIAKRAGEAIARVPGATTIDAIVMASAAAPGSRLVLAASVPTPAARARRRQRTASRARGALP